MFYCVVYVRQPDGSRGVLNRLQGAIYLSPLIKREAYSLRDKWRLATEPHAAVAFSYDRPL